MNIKNNEYRFFQIFLDKFDETIELLKSKKSYLYVIEDTEFHQYLVAKHNSIIYAYQDNCSKNSQNPLKFPKPQKKIPKT